MRVNSNKSSIMLALDKILISYWSRKKCFFPLLVHPTQYWHCFRKKQQVTSIIDVRFSTKSRFWGQTHTTNILQHLHFIRAHCPENISRQIVSDNYFYSGMLVLGTSFLRENKTKNLVEICFPHFKQLLDLSHFTFTVFLLVWPCQNRFFKKLKYQDI